MQTNRETKYVSPSINDGTYSRGVESGHTVEKSKRKAKFWNKPSRESSRVDTNARWARAFLYILPFFFGSNLNEINEYFVLFF